MNGFNKARTQQLPADSSGIINMSSPSGSSDSGSSASLMEMHMHGGMAGGVGPMTLVPATANPSVISPLIKGGERRNEVSKKVQNQPAFMGSPSKPLKSPSLGKPAAMHHNISKSPVDASRQNTADIFLSQFQAQMSQMKSAMDAVQNEILLHSNRSRGGVVPGGSRRGRKSGAGNVNFSSAQPVTTVVPGVAGPVRYQSQISTSNGLKLKIKKSPKPNKRKASQGKLVKGRRGRAKKRKNDEDDDDDMSDTDSDFRRVAHSNSTKHDNGIDNHESAVLGPSGWGDSLPEAVLMKIFSHAVRYEDGCIPFLVR
jgi:hypothetical protein